MSENLSTIAGKLNFDVLLGMSWIKRTNAILHAAEGIVSVNGEKL